MVTHSPTVSTLSTSEAVSCSALIVELLYQFVQPIYGATLSKIMAHANFGFVDALRLLIQCEMNSEKAIQLAKRRCGNEWPLILLLPLQSRLHHIFSSFERFPSRMPSPCQRDIEYDWFIDDKPISHCLQHTSESLSFILPVFVASYNSSEWTQTNALKYYIDLADRAPSIETR